MNTSIQSTIKALLDLGCPPLPVAPKQDPRLPNCHHQTFLKVRFKGINPQKPEIQGDYCRISFTKVGDFQAPIKGDYCRLDENLQPIARFTGKNPSYIDRYGIPHTIQHREFQNRMPTEAELNEWFANPLNGIGTLGGHNGVDWLDFDAKNYPSQADCDREVEAIRQQVGATWVERTGSGGYRIAVRPQQKPTFTNFSTDQSGDRHIGEALWEGRFTVLAPTIHPNGNPYQRIELALPIEIESLEGIGIYPTKDEQSNQARRERRQKSGIISAASDPRDNPWDIRNFAEYLEGSHVDGNYYECRCPVHKGDSDNSLSIVIDTGAFWCWSGCDRKEIYQEAKKAAIAGGYNPPERDKLNYGNPLEPDPIAYAETVKEQNQRAEIEQAQRNEDGINGVISWVRNQPKNSVQPWGFAPLPAVSGSDVVQVGSHAEGHYWADEVGARLIVNVSATGSRKSTFYGQTTPEFFGTDRAIAVLPDSLNPTVDTLSEWAHLEGRHLGNVEDQNGKLRRAKLDTPAISKVTPANCDKAAAIEKMSDRNPINPAYKLACLNCIHNWRCGKEQGDGWGARNQASITLKQSRIRLNYGRLHGQGEEASLLGKAALILDESSGNVSRTETVKVSQQDIKDTFFQVDRSGDPALQQFKPLLTHLLTDGWKAGDRHYGTGKAKLIPLLQEFIPEHIDWAALERLEDENEELKAFGFKPDVEPLSDAEYRRLKKLQTLKWLAPDQQRDFDQLQSLPKRTKGQHQRLLTYRKYALTTELERERDALQKRFDGSKREKLSASEMMTKAAFLPKRWLRDFLLVLTDLTYGYAHWAAEGLTVTLPNSQHLEAIQRAQKVVLSDASELRSKSALSKKYGIPEDEIFIFEVEQPKGAAVETVQITGLGRLGKNRGEGLEKCRQALVAKLKELDPTHATFDWKELSGKRSPDADGVLFRDTVGSNDYKHCQSISTTIPRPNINALLAEYCVLNETTVDESDEGFQRFYRDHIAQALKQTRGRLREQLRPGENLTFYVMGDDEIPIQGDRQVAAADICPDAARKGEKSVRAIIEAAKWVLQQGQELTQSAVARATEVLRLHKGEGYTQQYVSRFWGRILDALQLFLGKQYKKCCSPNAADRAKVDSLIPVIEEIAHTGPPDSLDEVILWLSLDEWAIAFQVLSDTTKKMLVKCWVSMLPVGWVEAIA